MIVLYFDTPAGSLTTGLVLKVWCTCKVFCGKFVKRSAGGIYET